MNIFETLIILFFTFLAIITIFGLFRSIMLSSRQGEIFYQKLNDRIKPLRMYKMLDALGVDDKQYTRGHPVNEIEKHMNRCQQCGNTEQCDSELESGQITHADQYCPNNEDLLNTVNKSASPSAVKA